MLVLFGNGCRVLRLSVLSHVSKPRLPQGRCFQDSKIMKYLVASGICADGGSFILFSTYGEPLAY